MAGSAEDREDAATVPASPAEEHRRVAAVFTDRVLGVPEDAWDNPAPPEGWVARDVVRHLVEWFPAFLMPLHAAIDRFYTADVFMHTWDLARATGQDETLDPLKCAQMPESMAPLDELLRASGQFGPRVEVPADADIQTRFLAFIGRDSR